MIAKEKIIEQYIPMIYSLIKKFDYLHKNNEKDLVNSGIVGIMEAVETFNETSSFTTWCYYKVRKNLQLCKRDEFVIRVYQSDLDKGITARRESLVEELLTENINSNYTENTNTLQNMSEYYQIKNINIEKNTETPYTDLIDSELKHKTTELLRYLNRKFTEVECQIFYEYIYEGKNYNYLSKKYGRVSKLVINKIIKRLRREFKKQGLEDYQFHNSLGKPEKVGKYGK